MNNYDIEQQKYNEGFSLIAGVDEVGRGPLAGPVVACAVIMPVGCYIDGVTDSKKLSEKKRQLLKAKIEEKALAIAISFIDQKTIDEVNIYQATKMAMRAAIDQLNPQPDYILIDAMPLDLDIPSQSIIKGDLRSYTIGCASIIAKVVRDEYMCKMASLYPQYGFDKHKGYPTKYHLTALEQYGVLDIHRITYGPVQKVYLKTKNNK